MIKKITVGLGVIGLSALLYAQTTGTPANIRVLIDATGALVTSFAATVNPTTSVQFNNARLLVDSNGALVTTSSGGGGGAPTDATYITQTTNSDLSAEQALGSLSSGILRGATTTGVVTSLGDVLPRANGGLGIALSDPNADRVLFWDDSANNYAYLTMGTNLTITGTTLDASGGGGGPTDDNAILIGNGGGSQSVILPDCLSGALSYFAAIKAIGCNEIPPANPFDQNLNTTDSPTFNVLSVTSCTGCSDGITLPIELTGSDILAANGSNVIIGLDGTGKLRLGSGNNPNYATVDDNGFIASPGNITGAQVISSGFSGTQDTDISFSVPASTIGNGNNLTILAANGFDDGMGTATNGGNINIFTGSPNGAGTPGNININNTPGFTGTCTILGLTSITVIHGFITDCS